MREVMRPGGRLIAIAPVRHSKSTYFSHFLPAWFRGTYPDKDCIIASYQDRFAAGWGERARNVLARHGPRLFGVEIGVRDAASWWTLRRVGNIHDTTGATYTGGTGGSIEGKGGDLIILDDPYENEKEAESPTIRENKWNWIVSTLMNRAEPGASIIITLHRWHEDDVVGRLQDLVESEKGEHWTIIHFDAIAEEPIPDYDWRKAGEPLCPERYPLDVLLKRKATIGTYYWNAIWQGRPSPPSGAVFLRDWWKYWTEVPKDIDIWIQSWDLKFKDIATRSYVVGQLWAARGPDKYLVDEVRAHWGFRETVAQIKNFTRKHPMTAEILIEEKANGPAVMEVLRDEISGVIPWDPGDRSKVARARAVSGQVESGNVWLPSPAIPGKGWVNDYVEELAFFPHGTYEDRVDATTQTLERLRQSERELIY